MIDHAIQAFGQRLGLASLSLSPEGLARLDIEGLGSLYLETAGQGGELLVYLASPIPGHDTRQYRRLLELCDYRRGEPYPLSAGVYSGTAVVATRLPAERVDDAQLENVLRFLAEALHG